MNTVIILVIVITVILVGCARFTNPGDTNYNGPRDTVYYGYYGDLSYQYEEVKDHVNTVWIAAWDRHPRSWVDVVHERVLQASKDGIKSVIMMTNDTYVNKRFNYIALSELEELFNKLDTSNLLDKVVAIYPTDEPDGSGISSEEIAKGNAAIRNVMSKYPALKNTALAVFYTGSEQYQGIQYYDWVGFDEYDIGEKALQAKYRRMLTRLRSDQRTMIIPGGCDKWRQDPRPFVDFALENPRVVALVPFIWIDNAAPGNDDVGLGIRSNGLANLYRDAGRTFLLPR